MILQIESLPEELLVMVSSFLSGVELMRWMSASKKIWCISQEDSLWRALCEKHHWTNKRHNMTWRDWFHRKMMIEYKWYRADSDYTIMQSPHRPDFVYLVWWEKEEGKILLSASGKTIRRWDVTTGELLATVNGHTEDVSAIRPLDFERTGAHLVSASQDGTIRMWRYCVDVDPVSQSRTAECVRVCRGHRAPVTCVLVAADGDRLVSSSYDGTVRVWSAVTGECLSEMRGHTDWIWVMQLGNDGRTVATGSDDATLRVWDVVECKEICVLKGHDAMVTCLQFECNSGEGHGSPGPLVSGSLDGTLCVWNIQRKDGEPLERRPVHRLVGHSDGVTCMCLRDNRALSGSADRTMRLWDIDTGECLRVFPLESPTVWCVRFDDFKAISGTGHNQVEVWNIRTGARLYELPKVLISRQLAKEEACARERERRREEAGSRDVSEVINNNSNGSEEGALLSAEMGDIEGEEITIFQLGEETLVVGSSGGKVMFFNFGANVDFPPPRGRWNPFQRSQNERTKRANGEGNKRERDRDDAERPSKWRRGDSEDYPGPEPCQKCR